MKYIVTEPQLSVFLRRRVSPEELEEMVNHTKKQIDGGEKVGYAVRESIRSFLDKTLPETHDVQSIGIIIICWKNHLLLISSFS
jgi:hypothetical protein